MSNTTKQAKLSANQTAVLDYFDTEEAGTVQQIAKVLDRKPGALTSVLASLVKRGLLNQMPTDDGALYTQIPVLVSAEDLPEAGDTPEAPSVFITEELASALDKATELHGAGREFETTGKGDMAKVVTVGKAYVTTDGRFIAAKGTLDGTAKEPWALYRATSVDTVDRGLALVGTFKSSSAALKVGNLTD
jgi:hypothetical protein